MGKKSSVSTLKVQALNIILVGLRLKLLASVISEMILFVQRYDCEELAFFLKYFQINPKQIFGDRDIILKITCSSLGTRGKAMSRFCLLE